MYVLDIIDTIKNKPENTPIKLILPNDTIIDLSTQQYVVDGEYHIFAYSDGFDNAYQTPHTIGLMKQNLEYEASDECWRTRDDIFDDGVSDFTGCEAYVITGNYDNYNDCTNDGTYQNYEIYGSIYKDDILYFMCDVNRTAECDEYTPKYDITLKEMPGEQGLTKTDVIDLFDKLNDESAYPIELFAIHHESSAMGFITSTAADLLDYDYEASGLHAFIANILDDMKLESPDCTYTFKDIKIWLSR